VRECVCARVLECASVCAPVHVITAAALLLHKSMHASHLICCNHIM